jgi:hypothetical protein
MGKTLSKSDIVAASDIKTVEVEVPEWGGSVAVRELNGTERDAFEQSLMKTGADGKRMPDLANMAVKLCAWCIVDGETGDRLFADEHLPELANKNAVALSRVFKVAQRINGMGSDAVEDAAKNSPAAPSGSSTFG